MFGSRSVMFSAIFALASAQTALPSAEPPIPPDIVVTAERARKVRFHVGKDKAGAIVCEIKRSSGDAVIDTRVCEIARACVSADVTNAQRAEVIACFKPRFDAMVAIRAAELRAATGGNG